MDYSSQFMIQRIAFSNLYKIYMLCGIKLKPFSADSNLGGEVAFNFAQSDFLCKHSLEYNCAIYFRENIRIDNK
jgi:hypothetical protein